MVKKTKLMEEFEEETGKHAVWGGEVTKAFKDWKKERRLQKLTICPWCGKRVKDYTTHKCSRRRRWKT